MAEIFDDHDVRALYFDLVEVRRSIQHAGERLKDNLPGHAQRHIEKALNLMARVHDKLSQKKF